MMVKYAWIVEEYGAVLANKLRDIAENNYFLKTPLDSEGHMTYFQHEGKHIVQVRYHIFKNVNDQQGRESTHVWHGMTSDGSMVTLQEEVI